MGNLSEHAKRELQSAGLFDKSGDFYEGLTGKAVMELIEVFEKQGHSGMSAPRVIKIFSIVANMKPLNPIMCTDDEWGEIGIGDTDNSFQNNRLSSIFKKGKDGHPYYLDAIVWEDKDGSCYTGTAKDSNGKEISSRQFINIPFEPKTFYVKVDENDVIVDQEELKKALEYYKQM